MKKITVLLLAVMMVAGMAACKDDVNKLLTFYIEQDVEMEFKSGLLGGTVLDVLPVSVATNSENEFQNNNTRADLVKDITLEKAVLTITNPSDENFDFLESIKVYASTNSNDEVLVAYRDQIPESIGDTLHLKSTNVKLDKYVKSDTYKVRTEAKLDGAARDMTVRTDLRFKVIADPL